MHVEMIGCTESWIEKQRGIPFELRMHCIQSSIEKLMGILLLEVDCIRSWTGKPFELTID